MAGAKPHRFRHTLASELLGKGGSIDEIAAILADNPSTIRRYYAKWTPEYQNRFGTGGRTGTYILNIQGLELVARDGIGIWSAADSSYVIVSTFH